MKRGARGSALVGPTQGRSNADSEFGLGQCEASGPDDFAAVIGMGLEAMVAIDRQVAGTDHSSDQLIAE